MNASPPFDMLPAGHFGAVLADCPWHFQPYSHIGPTAPDRAPRYNTMRVQDIAALPVHQLAAPDCALFMWGIWVMLPQVLRVISDWGFSYKTCAFNWSKADVSQIDMFHDNAETQLGLGYWVRQDSEFCLLATRGRPKRRSASVHQGIIERRREHSRKPDCVHRRIEQLVDGPYLELFARQRRPNWSSWGDEVEKFSRAGAKPTLAPPTKPVASPGSEALGLNSGFDSRDGSQL